MTMESAMPCKVKNHQCRESYGKKSNTRRSKYACLVEANESTRKRLERTLPKDREDRIAGKGINSLNSLSHYDLVRKFVPMPQATKIPESQAAVQSKEQKKGHQRGTERSKNSSFGYADGYLSSQKLEVETEITKNTKVRLCSEVAV